MKISPLLLGFALLASSCDTPAPGSHTEPPPPTPPSKCGDGVCSMDESCLSCVDDCGACPACAAAPSCTGSMGVPPNPEPRDDLDKGIDRPPPDMAGVDMSAGDGGAPSSSEPPAVYDKDCSAPQLKVRLRSITAAKHGGTLYCIVTASDGVREEVVLTQKTKDLKDGDTNYFDSMLTTVWGGMALQPTTNNLTLTYQCYKVGSDAWSKALGALGDAAGKAADSGPYGWAFGVASAGAAAAAAAAKATEGDEYRLNEQQTIDRKQLLDLTNGREWKVRQKGSCGLLCDYDWTLVVETWGCANTKVPNPD